MNLIKNTLTLLLFWLACSGLFAQTWEQATRFGASERETPLKMVTDSMDNIYVLGYYESNSLTFAGTTTLTRDGSTEQDYFLAKYNDKLEFQWAQNFGPGARRFGSGALSRTVGLDLAPNGDPIVVVNLTGDTVEVANTQVAFNDVQFEDWVRAGVIRLNATDGTVAWSRFPEQYGADDPIDGPYFTGITVNDQGEIFVGGTVTDVGLTIDTSSVSLPIGTSNESTVYAFSLDSSGRSRWARLMYHNDGTNDLFISGYPTQMTTGTDGGLFMAWYDPSGRGSANATNDGHHIQKLDPASGNRQWSYYLGTLKGSGDRWVGLEPLSDGSVMALFTFREIVDLGGGIATPDKENETGVVARIAADGTAKSVRQIKTLINGPYAIGNDLLIDPRDISAVDSGKFLLTGSFYGDLSLTNGTTLTGEKLNGAIPGEDVLVLELDTALTILGALQAGSNNTDRGYGVEWSSRETAWVMGDFILNPVAMFAGPITFGDTALTSVGRHDVFIAEGNMDATATSVSAKPETPQIAWTQVGDRLIIRPYASLTSLQLYNMKGQQIGKLPRHLASGQTLEVEMADQKGLLILQAEYKGRLIHHKIFLR